MICQFSEICPFWCDTRKNFKKKKAEFFSLSLQVLYCIANVFFPPNRTFFLLCSTLWWTDSRVFPEDRGSGNHQTVTLVKPDVITHTATQRGLPASGPTQVQTNRPGRGLGRFCLPCCSGFVCLFSVGTDFASFLIPAWLSEIERPSCRFACVLRIPFFTVANTPCGPVSGGAVGAPAGSGSSRIPRALDTEPLPGVRWAPGFPITWASFQPPEAAGPSLEVGSAPPSCARGTQLRLPCRDASSTSWVNNQPATLGRPGVASLAAEPSAWLWNEFSPLSPCGKRPCSGGGRGELRGDKGTGSNPVSSALWPVDSGEMAASRGCSLPYRRRKMIMRSKLYALSETEKS